jgi:phage shock protein C
VQLDGAEPRLRHMLSKRLYRSERDRVVAGVAGGLADYLGWNPTIVRLLWLLAFIPGGIPGLLPYLVCWLVVPSESRTRTWS